MQFLHYKNKRAFTLIELLIVIAIIGILAGVVLVSTSSARDSAKDAKRASEIRSVRTALEAYYISNGYYPSSADVIFPGILSTTLIPTYFSAIPMDPDSPSRDYHYYTASQNPAQFYAIYVPYVTKSPCYVCGGTPCYDGTGWWGVPMCK